MGPRVDMVTQKQAVLRLLSDHKPHTHHELYALGCVAHSRVSDLRADGHVINQWRLGDKYLYQLVDTLDEPEVAGSSSGSSSVPTADGADLLAGSPSPLLEQTGTLVLFPSEQPVRGAYSGGEAA